MIPALRRLRHEDCWKSEGSLDYRVGAPSPNNKREEENNRRKDVCAHVHAYECVCMCVWGVCVHVCESMYVCVHVCECMHVSVYVSMCACVWGCVYMCMRVCVCTCDYVCECVCVWETEISWREHLAKWPHISSDHPHTPFPLFHRTMRLSLGRRFSEHSLLSPRFSGA